MTQFKDLCNHLNSLLKLLEEEEEALIHNDVSKISELVEKKNEYVEVLSQYSLSQNDVIPTAEEKSQLVKLVEEINSIQETNLLLTKQSLSYQNSLLEAISKNIQNTSNTYSAKGDYQKSNNIGLIDQEV
ncbi:flagellar export chaperone FlgN [Paratissierella segnis]|jgi:hypothetical protein|uniref:Flagellar export chaperone FlgN n=1 Tax=Paratissierella segnis TaxID=2763679 RepID=A0A926ERC3_9FIRM|nr:flagellar export chaperone FlgN [Paratissierella segnis]MBC8588303.1 flagellar export chaperone FlgN [Paratissierella segnis]